MQCLRFVQIILIRVLMCTKVKNRPCFGVVLRLLITATPIKVLIVVFFLYPKNAGFLLQTNSYE